MGWDFSHRTKGMSNREFFTKDWKGITIHADSTIENVWYAAAEHESEPGKIFALVYLISRAPNSYFNFGYKSQSEDMGPNASKAPAKILDLLSPTDNEYALAWRERCRSHAEFKASRPSLAGLKHGDVVILHRKMQFTNGASLDRFEIRIRFGKGGRRLPVLHSGGVNYRIPRWRDMVTEVVTA